MSVTIKEIDERVFRNFKAEAARRGLKLGRAATEALRLWISLQTPQRIRDRDGMLRAAREIDKLREKSPEDWSGVEVIRSWREQRR